MAKDVYKVESLGTSMFISVYLASTNVLPPICGERLAALRSWTSFP